MRIIIVIIIAMHSLDCFALHSDLLVVDSLLKIQDDNLAYSKILKIDEFKLTNEDLIDYYLLKGRTERYLALFYLSSKSLGQGINLLDTSDFSDRTYEFYFQLSIVTRNLHEFHLATEYAHKAEEIASILGNNSFLYESNLILSSAYKSQKEIDSSLFYLKQAKKYINKTCLLYTSPSPRDS